MANYKPVAFSLCEKWLFCFIMKSFQSDKYAKIKITEMAYWIFLHLKMYRLTQYVIFAFISYPSYQNTMVLFFS